MRKKLAVVLLIVTAPLLNFGQRTEAGIKGGFNLGNIDGSYSDDAAGSLNVHAGVFVSRQLSRVTALQVECLLNSLSTVVYEEIDIAGESYLNPKHTTLGYMSFPFLFRLSLNRRISLILGPQYSLLTSKNKRLTNSDTDAFKNGNWSLAFGMQFSAGKRLLFHGRINPGLSSTGHRTSGMYFNNRGKTSLVVQTGIGYRIFD